MAISVRRAAAWVATAFFVAVRRCWRSAWARLGGGAMSAGQDSRSSAEIVQRVNDCVSACEGIPGETLTAPYFRTMLARALRVTKGIPEPLDGETLPPLWFTEEDWRRSQMPTVAYRELAAHLACRERQLRAALLEVEVAHSAPVSPVSFGEIEGIVERVLQRYGVASPRERVDVFAHHQFCGRAASDGGAA